MVRMDWQPAPEGLAQIIPLLKVRSWSEIFFVICTLYNFFFDTGFVYWYIRMKIHMVACINILGRENQKEFLLKKMIWINSKWSEKWKNAKIAGSTGFLSRECLCKLPFWSDYIKKCGMCPHKNKGYSKLYNWLPPLIFCFNIELVAAPPPNCCDFL